MRISPDYLGSEAALREHSWLPAEPRPTTDALARKQNALTSSLEHWESSDAFISHTVFDSPASVRSDGKSGALVPGHGVVLRPNAWPYQTPPGTHHDVLWLADGLQWTDAEIDQQLRLLLPRAAQYVWYDNPKPSFVHGQNLRHVQVLWRAVLDSAPRRPLVPPTASVTFLCPDAEGSAETIPADLLRAFSSQWRLQRDTWTSAFATKKVRALRRVLEHMVGKYDGPEDLSYATLTDALSPAWAHGMSGVLSYGLRHVSKYDEFRTQHEDIAVQTAILWYDAHGYQLPEYVRLRLMKTVIGSTWIGAPFMWKVSTDPALPGFPLMRLRSRVLFNLRRMAMQHDDSMRMSPVDIVLRIRYARRFSAQLRRRVGARPRRS